jgi:hypothetical protein
MQPTPMKQQNLNLMNRKKDTDWRRVTQRKENYESQMGKWVWFVFYYSFHLLNLELSATNPLGCKFWGEPPRWVSVEKQDARTLHMISSCFADLSKILCRLFSQFLLCSRILSPSLTPAGFSCTVFCCQVEVVRTLVKFKPSISLYVGVCSAADSSYTVVPHDQF